MLLKYVEIAASIVAGVLAVILSLISLRYRKEILAAERYRAVRKLHLRLEKAMVQPTGVKEAEPERELVGVK